MVYSNESHLIIVRNTQYAGMIAGVSSCKPAEGKIYAKEEIK
jgi:hypothetical protein